MKEHLDFPARAVSHTSNAWPIAPGCSPTFWGRPAGLGEKLGCLLVQLPPSPTVNAALVRDFLRLLRERHSGPVVREAGHLPGGFAGLVYLHLHDSPRRYHSACDRAVLNALVARLQFAATPDADVWCVLDNTAKVAAIEDALHTEQGLAQR